jgi:HK97 family phage prohead protease
MHLKYSFNNTQLVEGPQIGERQILVIASDGTLDRDGDILEAQGCDLTNFNANPVVLAQHDPKKPIGTAKAWIKDNALMALITFAAKGISAVADEYCDLAKTGIINSISVGFNALQKRPLQNGGFLIKKWELLEISLVSVPANPAARIVQRTYLPQSSKTGREISARNVTKLQNVHDQIEQCRMSIAEMLEHVAAPSEMSDTELAVELETIKRRFDLGYADLGVMHITEVRRTGDLEQPDNERQVRMRRAYLLGMEIKKQELDEAAREERLAKVEALRVVATYLTHEAMEERAKRIRMAQSMKIRLGL